MKIEWRKFSEISPNPMKIWWDFTISSRNLTRSGEIPLNPVEISLNLEIFTKNLILVSQFKFFRVLGKQTINWLAADHWSSQVRRQSAQIQSNLLGGSSLWWVEQPYLWLVDMNWFLSSWFIIWWKTKNIVSQPQVRPENLQYYVSLKSCRFGFDLNSNL